MIEYLEIIAIFGCCGFLTWAAMKKHNPKIEHRLDEIDAYTQLIEGKLRK